MGEKSIGFIGGGRVASILLGGWSRAGAMPAKVVVFDCSADALAKLKARRPEVSTTGNAEEAAVQDIVFLAVHPPVIKDALPAVAPPLRPAAILVSLAPKFTIAKLSEMLGGFARIARMIPNAPSVVGRGYNPMTLGPALTAADGEALRKLLAPLGECPQVPEPHLEAYAIVAAMGPTYFWPQIYALKSLGESFGLSAKDALEAVDRMLWGAVATIKESGLSPEQVQDLIPVKPMADEVAALTQAYQTKLKGLMEKIRP